MYLSVFTHHSGSGDPSRDFAAFDDGNDVHSFAQVYNNSGVTNGIWPSSGVSMRGKDALVCHVDPFDSELFKHDGGDGGFGTITERSWSGQLNDVVTRAVQSQLLEDFLQDALQSDRIDRKFVDCA